MNKVSRSILKKHGEKLLKTLDKKPINKDVAADWKLEKLLASGRIVAEYVVGKGVDAETAKKASATLSLEIESLQHDLETLEAGTASSLRGRGSRKYQRCLSRASKAFDECAEDILSSPLPESDGPGTDWLDDPIWQCQFQLLTDMADCNDQRKD